MNLLKISVNFLIITLLLLLFLSLIFLIAATSYYVKAYISTPLENCEQEYKLEAYSSSWPLDKPTFIQECLDNWNTNQKNTKSLIKICLVLTGFLTIYFVSLLINFIHLNKKRKVSLDLPK